MFINFHIQINEISDFSKIQWRYSRIEWTLLKNQQFDQNAVGPSLTYLAVDRRMAANERDRYSVNTPADRDHLLVGALRTIDRLVLRTPIDHEFRQTRSPGLDIADKLLRAASSVIVNHLLWDCNPIRFVCSVCNPPFDFIYSIRLRS